MTSLKKQAASADNSPFGQFRIGHCLHRRNLCRM
jgi:hypothetical protein